MLSQFQSSGLVTGRCWSEQGLEEDGCGWKTGLTSGSSLPGVSGQVETGRCWGKFCGRAEKIQHHLTI